MRHLAILLGGISILAAAEYAQTETAAPAGDQRGRYEGVVGSATSVWVVDTHTGRVRKCTQEFADQTPSCSALSN